MKDVFKKNIIPIFIFILIILYLIISIIKNYFNNNSLTYTVIRDSMSLVEKTKAFLLMDEEVYKSNSDGYLYKIFDNYSYVSNNNFVACITENIFYDDNYKSLNLSKLYNFKKIKNTFREINDIKLNVLNTNYSFNNNEIYNFKLSSVDYVSSKTTINELVTSKSSGIVSYNVDGFENITMDNFENKYTSMMYKKNTHNNFDVIKNNDNVFKIIKSDYYKLLFKSSFNFDNNKNDIYINIKNIGATAKSNVNSFYNNKGDKFYYIELDDYLISLIDNRIIEIDIRQNKNTGLKIPLTSITSLNCYQIPKKFVFFDDSINSYYLKKINKYGEISNTEIRVLKIDSNSYYINEKDVYNRINTGDYIKSDDDSNFLISNQVIINGVLINDRGVDNFKNIDIIDKNQEYAIVSENTYNGIKIGDKIALNSVN